MMNYSEIMPCLFIGHGSPMNIIQNNTFTRSLKSLGNSLPKPKLILVISAHWLTTGTFITTSLNHQQIYDFYGFPAQLYDFKYPAKGNPKFVQQFLSSLNSTQIQGSEEWGLDHAAYMVLGHIYPKANIPVLELSLDLAQPLQYHYQLAKLLAPLRKKGVLIIGSGNLVHNLRIVNMDQDAQPYPWAIQFDTQVKQALLSRNHSVLLDYAAFDRVGRLANPTLDHYLPLIYAISLQTESEKLQFIHEGIQHGSISMRSFQIG